MSLSLERISQVILWWIDTYSRRYFSNFCNGTPILKKKKIISSNIKNNIYPLFGLSEGSEREEKMNTGKGKMWTQVIGLLTNLVHFLFSHIIQTMEKIKFLFISLLFLSLLFLSNQP